MSTSERFSICVFFRISLFLLLSCLLTGCGGDSGRAGIKGRVTIDQEVLKNGTISFSPSDGNVGPTAGGGIKDGYYSIDAAKGPAVGWNRVSIYGQKLTGRRFPDPLQPGMMMDEVVSLVPEQYNARSTLKKELKPGENIIDFDLSSK